MPSNTVGEFRDEVVDPCERLFEQLPREYALERERARVVKSPLDCHAVEMEPYTSRDLSFNGQAVTVRVVYWSASEPGRNFAFEANFHAARAERSANLEAQLARELLVPALALIFMAYKTLVALAVVRATLAGLSNIPLVAFVEFLVLLQVW